MTDSLSWVKWRFDKWRSDPGLRMCSLAARGLWIDILAVMHECQPYGHLVINGRAPTPRQIAALVGYTTEREVKNCLEELENANVFARTEGGAIFCRRLVRDNLERQRSKEFGARGGNPHLKGERPIRVKAQEETPVKGGVNPPVKIETEKETETESDSKKEGPPAPLPGVAEPKGEPEGVDAAFEAWNALAPKLGLPAAKKLDGDRRRKIAARLREGELAGWLHALRLIEETPFLRGENDRGWRPSLDWISQPANFRRVQEGTYGSLAPFKPPVAPRATTGPEAAPGASCAPPDPWGLHAWRASLPDLRPEKFDDGPPRLALNGWDPVGTGREIAEAADLPDSWRGSWDALAEWLRGDLWDPERALPAIKRQARRLRAPIFSIRIFDGAVRAAVGAPTAPERMIDA